jgi:lysozyme
LPPGFAEFIKQWEGFEARPYLCLAGVPTIGYGFTRYADGRRVTLADRPMGRDEAAALLALKIARFAAGVDGYLSRPTSAGQFGAMVSLAFNIGLGAFARSTLRRRFNAGDVEGAAQQFARWNIAGGQVSRGLTQRRKAEEAMFRGIMLAESPDR